MRPITSWQIEGDKVEAVRDFLFLGSKITVDGDCSHKIRRCFLLGRKVTTNLHSVLKSKDIICRQGSYIQGCGLPSSHIRMWELDSKESWVPKNWCLQAVVLEKTLESPLEGKDIKPVNLKGNQPWILFGRTDAKAEASILWPPDAKSWLIGKDPHAGKDWTQKKRATKDELVRWHHQFNAHELGQTLRDGEGQGSLVCCSPWGLEESDTA